MGRSIVFHGEIMVAPEDCTVREWAGWLLQAPEMSPDDVPFILEIVQLFAAKGVE